MFQRSSPTRSRLASALLVAASFAAPQDSAREQSPESGAASVEVCMLANEGFLLSAGDKSVLIDAFVAEPYAGYGSLSGDALDALLEAREPFAGVELALTSHVHRDHFQPEPAQSFLAAAPDCVFATSPQVIDALWSTEVADVREESVRDILPKPGETKTLELDGIRVDFLQLSHGIEGLTNLGHIITNGGMKILHVGDAEKYASSFAPFAKLLRDVDVALIPSWYFSASVGGKILATHLASAQLVACHIPPKDLKKTIAAFERKKADVIVFGAALDRKVFRKRKR